MGWCFDYDFTFEKLVGFDSKNILEYSLNVFNEYLKEDNAIESNDLPFLYAVLMAYGTGNTTLGIQGLFGSCEGWVLVACCISRYVSDKFTKEHISKAKSCLELLITRGVYKSDEDAYNVCTHCIEALSKGIKEKVSLASSSRQYKMFRTSRLFKGYNFNYIDYIKDISDILSKTSISNELLYIGSITPEDESYYLFPFYEDTSLDFSKFSKVRESISSIFKTVVLQGYDSYEDFKENWWNISVSNVEYHYREMLGACPSNPYKVFNDEYDDYYREFESPFEYKEVIRKNASDGEKLFFDIISNVDMITDVYQPMLRHKLGSNLFLDRWDIKPVIEFKDDGKGNYLLVRFSSNQKEYMNINLFDIYLDKEKFNEGKYVILDIKGVGEDASSRFKDVLLSRHKEDVLRIIHFLNYITDIAYKRHPELEFECVTVYAFATNDVCGVGHYLDCHYCSDYTDDLSYNYNDNKLHCTYVVSLQ